MHVQTSLAHLIVLSLIWFVCGLNVGLRIGGRK